MCEYPVIHVHGRVYVDTNQDCEFYSKWWLCLTKGDIEVKSSLVCWYLHCIKLDYIDSPLVILYFLRLDWDLINKDRVNLTFMLPFKSKLFTLITLKFVKILSLCYLNYLILIAVTQPKKLKLNLRNLICLIPEDPQDHPKIYTRAILFLMIVYLGAVTLPTKGNDTQIHKNRYILEHTWTLLQNSQGIGLIGYI